MPESGSRRFGGDGAFHIAQPAIEASVWDALTTARLIISAQIFDAIVIIVTSSFSYTLKPERHFGISLRHSLGTIGICIAAYFLFYEGRLYTIEYLLDAKRAIRSITIRWSILFIALAAFASLAHYPALRSRLWFAVFYGAGIVGFAVGRMTLATVMRRWIDRGYHTRSLAIVGSGEATELLIARLARNNTGIKVVGVFDDCNSDKSGTVHGVRKLGNLNELICYVNAHTIDTVIITLPLAMTEQIKHVARRLSVHPLAVRLLPGVMGLERVSPISLDRMEIPGVQLIPVANQPISETAMLAKGFLDRTAAAILLLLTSPVLLFSAAGIAISSRGPILFRQRRVGYKGREFNMIKFRTMHAISSHRSELTKRNDPRVFGFGKLLRKTSLDELPQLFNVLKGDMSLVGPRPHMPEARAAGRLYHDAVDDYPWRYCVKPGITGWAQVNGWRGPTETIEQIERRVAHDIYYIENWSFMFDLLILLKTVFVGFIGKNAF